MNVDPEIVKMGVHSTYPESHRVNLDIYKFRSNAEILLSVL